MTTSQRTLALFGATGKTGQHVLSQALDAGYRVHALARSPEKISRKSDHLTVVRGDVLDPESVNETVAGTNAVISVFGQVKGSPATVQTDGTRHIVTAMDAHGVTLLISLSGGGLRAEGYDRPKIADRVIRQLLKTFAGHVLSDAEGHLEVLRASGLDWTVVRGPRLTDGPATGAYRVGWVGVNASTAIARPDLAQFILTQVDDRQFIHQLPFASH